MAQVRFNNAFENNIPEDCITAMNELRRLKAYRLAALDDNINTFADVWWMILHEVDMFVEGEYTAADGGMNKAQAQAADKWLVKYCYLFDKYKTDDWSAGEMHYYGQT